MQTEITKLSPALIAFQAEVPNILKEAVNPFYKSKYASLDAIWDVVRPLLAKHKLAVSQFPCGDNELLTMIIHESGEQLGFVAKLHPKDDTPQGQGSAITYMRRYALSAALGLATETDDDGNAATHAPEAVKKAYQSSEPF
jgi:hypothetical protein